MDYLISIFIWLGTLIGIYVPVTVNQQVGTLPVVEMRAPVIVEIMPTAPKPKEITTIIVTPTSPAPTSQPTSTPQIPIPPLVIVIPMPTIEPQPVIPKPEVLAPVIQPEPTSTPPTIPPPRWMPNLGIKITVNGQDNKIIEINKGEEVTIYWLMTGESANCKAIFPWGEETVYVESTRKVVIDSDFVFEISCVGQGSGIGVKNSIEIKIK